MASQASAYRNSGDLKSANFAPAPPSPLVRRIDASRLPPRYAWTLRHFVIESQHGPDLWASTFRASFAAGVSYKTMQRHLDWLEREKILHKKHTANEFISGKGLRRPATYVLNGTSAKWLAPRETYPQWQKRNRRHAPSRKRPQSSAHSAQPVAPPQPALEPTKSAPVEVNDPRPLRRLTPREGPRLIGEMRRLMLGVTKVSGLGFPLASNANGFDMLPDDPRYRAPMTQENALVAACMNLGIPYESAREHLKLCRWEEGAAAVTEISTPEPSLPPSKAELRRDANLAANARAKQRLREHFGRPPTEGDEEKT